MRSTDVQRRFYPSAASTLIILTLLNGHARNLIQTENSRPGTTAWQLTNPATAGWPTDNNSVVPEIEGYASATSVNVNGSITFFIDVRDNSPAYTLEIYRMGWYGGLGGRAMTWTDSGQQTSIVTLQGQKQPIPIATSGYIDCSVFWTQSYTLTVPDSWLSGIYLAKLTTIPTGKQSYIIFVVREDSRPCDILFQSSVTTFEAYNPWGGMSLYAYPLQQTNVSFNRPYAAATYPWPVPAGQSATAAFVGTDSRTEGDWISANGTRTYGKHGYTVILDSQNLPGYCTTSTDASSILWGTPDLSVTQALRQVDLSGNLTNSRIAAAWCATNSFTVDMNFTDGNKHRVAMYCLDWNCLQPPLTQRIDVLDAVSNVVLDTRTLPISPTTNFCNGTYLIWDIGGHVQFKLTAPTNSYAVLSGIFLDPTPPFRADLAYGTGAGEFLTQINANPGPGWEYNALRWLERQGYDVTYCTSIDTHIGTNLTKGIKAFLSVGHDEYWSPEMRTNVLSARDTNGINLAFFSANVSYWQAHMDPSLRKFTVIKTNSRDRWSDANDIALTGLESLGGFPESNMYIPAPASSNFVFDWSPVVVGGSGTTLPLLAGYEPDGIRSNSSISLPLTSTILASSPAANLVGTSYCTIYPASSGALVFASGSMDWNWGLDDFGWQAQIPHSDLNGGPRSRVHPVARQMAHNIFTHFRGDNTKPAIFLGPDGNTQGTWIAAYGVEGYELASGTTPDFARLPPTGYAIISIQGQTPLLWASSSADGRALQKPPPSTDRVAAAWSSSTNFTIDVTLSDGYPHQVGLYCIDWLGIGTRQRIDVINVISGLTEDTRDFAVPTNGVYLLWTLTNHYQINVTRTDQIAGSAALASGLFVGAAGTAQFVGADLTTQGNWISDSGTNSYGSEGYNIIADQQNYPPYCAVSTDAATYSWGQQALATTKAVRMVDSSGIPLSNRIAAVWYPASDQNFNVDINIADGVRHQVTAYFLDWDLCTQPNTPRREAVEVYDAVHNLLLSSQSLPYAGSDFCSGTYLSWLVAGHVKLRCTTLNQDNPVLSALFFDPDILATNPPAQLAVSPGNLGFGPVIVGQTNTQSFQVVNDAGQPLDGTAATVSPFSISGGSPYNLAPGQTGMVTVAFSPTSSINYSNIVIFSSNGTNTITSVTGSGLAPPQLSVSPASLDFGVIAVGSNSQATFVVTNLGAAGLSNGVASVNGGPFSVMSGTPFSLPGNGSTNLVVVFSPGAVGSFTNVVSFTTSNGGNTTNTLTGMGAVAPMASFIASPTNGVAPLTVVFTDNSSGTITNWFWEFGDGTSSNTTTTVLGHTYAAAGTNTVVLIVGGPLGSSSLSLSPYIVVTNPAPLTLSIQLSGSQVRLVWSRGTLQAAPQVNGPYSALTNVTSPYVLPPSGAAQFFRAKVQ